MIKNPEKSKDRDKQDKEKDGADITAHRSSTKGHVAELANKLRDGVHIGGGPPKKRGRSSLQPEGIMYSKSKITVLRLLDIFEAYSLQWLDIFGNDVRKDNSCIKH